MGSDTDWLGGKAWLVVGVLIHPEGDVRVEVMGLCRAEEVFPHQCWPVYSICRRNSYL